MSVKCIDSSDILPDSTQNGKKRKFSHILKKPTSHPPSLFNSLSSVSHDRKIKLTILSQPEEQHRARYLTEGSRGPIKDRDGSGFPTVQLLGYSGQSATLQIFIVSDQGKPVPHIYYQASKVSGKNSTFCREKKQEGTNVILVDMKNENDYLVCCDCVGILKERYSDIQQKIPEQKLRSNWSKKKSTKCRMVFRVELQIGEGESQEYESIQIVSDQISCTQLPGTPEILRMSTYNSHPNGRDELWMIGKNFLKDTVVIFEQVSLNKSEPLWTQIVHPDRDFFSPTHLICQIPSHVIPPTTTCVEVSVMIMCGGKKSDPQAFIYDSNLSICTRCSQPVDNISMPAILEAINENSHSNTNSLSQSPIGIKQTFGAARVDSIDLCEEAVFDTTDISKPSSCVASSGITPPWPSRIVNSNGDRSSFSNIFGQQQKVPPPTSSSVEDVGPFCAHNNSVDETPSAAARIMLSHDSSASVPPTQIDFPANQFIQPSISNVDFSKVSTNTDFHPEYIMPVKPFIEPLAGGSTLDAVMPNCSKIINTEPQAQSQQHHSVIIQSSEITSDRLDVVRKELIMSNQVATSNGFGGASVEKDSSNILGKKKGGCISIQSTESDNATISITVPSNILKDAECFEHVVNTINKLIPAAAAQQHREIEKQEVRLIKESLASVVLNDVQPPQLDIMPTTVSTSAACFNDIILNSDGNVSSYEKKWVDEIGSVDSAKKQKMYVSNSPYDDHQTNKDNVWNFQKNVEATEWSAMPNVKSVVTQDTNWSSTFDNSAIASSAQILSEEVQWEQPASVVIKTGTEQVWAKESASAPMETGATSSNFVTSTPQQLLVSSQWVNEIPADTSSIMTESTKQVDDFNSKQWSVVLPPGETVKSWPSEPDSHLPPNSSNNWSNEPSTAQTIPPSWSNGSVQISNNYPNLSGAWYQKVDTSTAELRQDATECSNESTWLPQVPLVNEQGVAIEQSIAPKTTKSLPWKEPEKTQPIVTLATSQTAALWTESPENWNQNKDPITVAQTVSMFDTSNVLPCLTPENPIGLFQPDSLQPTPMDVDVHLKKSQILPDFSNWPQTPTDASASIPHGFATGSELGMNPILSETSAIFHSCQNTDNTTSSVVQPEMSLNLLTDMELNRI